MAAREDDVADDKSLLVVLVETNPRYWAASEGKGDGTAAANGLSSVLEATTVFLNSFFALNQQNRAAVIAVHDDGCHYLYTSPLELNAGDASASATGKKRTKTATPSSRAAMSSPFAGALSLALCYCNRAQTLETAAGLRVRPRILCLQASQDNPTDYISMMNAIFSAQRQSIPIDAFALGEHDLPFLQQAAHITRGAYVKPTHGAGLLQYLLSTAALDMRSRSHLKLPAARGVDFRASCFCHKRPVSVGFVCSVCLSIFCERRSSCDTCGADFAADAQVTSVPSA
ncbi:predicted protein [Ostreococcus lucimarinus CCE9901]|uniref:General transcription and DNA repair factor IIH subunit TFB4 n=1 Tax=Ostreococcus lucimarinus (strain CCE9901) TaxID=436017 RepID=A4RQX7_OSTLU|nr:predicted protein [Ostreococcus lucimarinus CCE9901]ABO93759.1 predicted protein [Ostreococcus lucimarinus CCE9901]|eukprot:XP_001415467.1 predicted protein [Ostreococcus lucimarinus CCE9901]